MDASTSSSSQEANGQVVNAAELLQQFESVLANTYSFRNDFLGRIVNVGGNWDKIDQECGYPSTSQLSPQFYRDLFDRDPIANRVVELMPKETWQNSPSVYEDEDAENVTAFEKAWDELGTSLSPGGTSHFDSEKGSLVWEYLSRADILSGIGQFGVILLGVDDGRNLADPVDCVEVVANVLSIRERKGDIVSEVVVNHKGQRVKRHKTKRTTTVNVRRTATFRVADSPETEYERGLKEQDRSKGVVVNDTGPLVSTPTTNAPAPKGSVPSNGPFVQGTDGAYDKGWGVYPGSVGDPTPKGSTSGSGDPRFDSHLSGTDAQYFGVQFGPSEKFSNRPSKTKRRLLFMRVFDESLVQVVRYEWNIRNPRFGLPVMYRITLNDPRQPHSGVGLPLATVYVHWSRVIHVADNLHTSEIFGKPRMMSVINPILDCRKVRGAGAEGYWKTAFTGYSVETHPQLGGDVIFNQADMKEQWKNFFAGLNRVIAGTGVSVKTLAPTVVDPTPHIERAVEAICIKLGCPVRVFKGSERGELASLQDDESWNERKRERQHNYLTPKIIVPFVDRLIQIGILPEPEQFWVDWPDLDALGDADKATIALSQTQALAAYVSGGVEAVIPPHDYLTRIMGMEDTEATEILDAAEQAQEDKMQEHSDLAQEQGFEPEPPPGFVKPEPPTPPQPGAPGGPPVPPVSVKPGERLVHPATGKVVAKGPPMPKPTRNESVDLGGEG